MTYNADLPSSSTKIRNYPTVLTENFQAIEEGQDSLAQWKSNYIERNGISGSPPVDPTRIDDTMQVYAKQNADGETDLYVLDDRGSANVIELTENGKLGGRSQDLVMNEFYFGTDAQGYGQWAIPSAWGYVANGPTLSYGHGVSSVAGSGNFTRITWDTDYILNANYAVMVTSGTSAHQVSFTLNKTSTYIDVGQQSLVGVHTKGPFSFVVFGGR